MPKYIISFVFNNFNFIFFMFGLILSTFVILIAKEFIKEKIQRYYIVSFVFLISFSALIYTESWLGFIVAWELVTITTTLILLWRGRGLASQYFIFQFSGTAILFLSFLLAMNQGYDSIMPINEVWLQNLLVLGVGMKSAILGFHFWMPAIYSKAPIPFNAISSGWVVKLGFILLLKVIPHGNALLFVLGILMVFYGGFKALIASDFKVLLAFSSVSQLGFIAIGIASGTVYGYLGSIFHIIAHGLAKSSLFIICGQMVKEYASSCIYDFKVFFKRHPLSSFTMIIAFASLIGVPLLAGFNSKYLLKFGLNNQIFFAIMMYAATLLTALYSLRFLYWGIFKDLLPSNGAKEEKKRQKNFQLPSIHYLVLLLLSSLILLVGLQAELIMNAIMEIDFTYNLFIGFIENLIIITLAYLILRYYNYFQLTRREVPSLDGIFQKLYKILYNIGRKSYNWIYQDFQYQLLCIPLFLIIILLWGLFFV
ncbi:complex I subunit 5 family protein [Natronospora cellulosivora (SeqCode)]